MACSRSTTTTSREIAPYIDWTPFFRTWELKGTFPKILDDPVVGPTARSLYADAQSMLERIVAERWVTARAVVGLWPAAADGDDVVVYARRERSTPLATLHTLRQQLPRDGDHANLALADFIAPIGSGVDDYMNNRRPPYPVKWKGCVWLKKGAPVDVVDSGDEGDRNHLARRALVR